MIFIVSMVMWIYSVKWMVLPRYFYGSNTKKILIPFFHVKRGIHYVRSVFDFRLFVVINEFFDILIDKFVFVVTLNVHFPIFTWIVFFFFLIIVFDFDIRFGFFFLLFCLFHRFFTKGLIHVK